MQGEREESAMRILQDGTNNRIWWGRYPGLRIWRCQSSINEIVYDSGPVWLYAILGLCAVGRESVLEKKRHQWQHPLLPEMSGVSWKPWHPMSTHRH